MKDKRQIAQFCSQLKSMLAAGVPLHEGLTIIADLNRKQSAGITAVAIKIAEGEALAAAMTDGFPLLLTGSIRCAERSGDLEGTLERMAKYYGDAAETEEKIKNALIYPAFVMGLSLLTLFGLFVFILPGFKDIFADLGGEMPLLTRVVLLLSDFWYWPVLFITAAALLSRKQIRRAPLLRSIAVKSRIIHDFKALGALLAGGVSISDALAGFPAMSEIKRAVEDGEKFSAAVSLQGCFPRQAVEMLVIGENSAALPQMLVSIADFYEKEREVFIKRFTTLLEPAMTLAVGAVVALIALAVFLPMMTLISNLQ